MNVATFCGFLTQIIQDRRPGLSVELFRAKDGDTLWAVVRDTSDRTKARMSQSRRELAALSPGEARGAAHRTAVELMRALDKAREAAAVLRATARPEAQGRDPRPPQGGPAPIR